MPNIAIASSGDSDYIKLLSEIGTVVHRNSDHLDLILFTGGEDVSPTLYGGTDNGYSSFNTYRDQFEKKVFLDCVKRNIKMVGICRGIQFLNVMAGGKMYQHTVGHGGVRHTIKMLATNSVCEVICTHHQMIIPTSSVYIIAQSAKPLSNLFIGPNCKEHSRPNMEVEAAIFPNINAFGVQFHPEFQIAPRESADLFVEMTTMFLHNDLETFIATYGRKANEQRGQEASA